MLEMHGYICLSDKQNSNLLKRTLASAFFSFFLRNIYFAYLISPW